MTIAWWYVQHAPIIMVLVLAVVRNYVCDFNILMTLMKNKQYYLFMVLKKVDRPENDS